MKQYLLFILYIFTIQATAQTNSPGLVGNWKSYLDDKITFEYISFNPDGSGMKCFGQTINGKDSLFFDHFTKLNFSSWKIENNTLIIKTEPDEIINYKFILIDNNKISLEGEHLRLDFFPTSSNHDKFQRKVDYQKFSEIPKGYGVNKTVCISEIKNLFTFTSLDSNTLIAKHEGFEDLIPYIISCNINFDYIQKYYAPSYSINIPKFINQLNFGFGSKLFSISFTSKNDDDSETSITIYYDFKDTMKSNYFSQIANGEEKKDVLIQNDIPIYKTLNYQGKYEGKIFLDKSIIVAYYTKRKEFQEQLQKCITSFNYK